MIARASALALAAAAAGCGGGGDAPTRSDTIAALSVGHSHACLLTRTGEIWCWGSNRMGSVGVRSGGLQYHSEPVRVAVPPAAQVAALDGETCVELRSGGGVQCWGGGLTDEDARLRDLAVRAGRLVARDGDGCVLRDGEVWCWGKDDYQRVIRPHQLALHGSIVDVAMGGRHGCALHDDRTVACWSDPRALDPTPVDGLDGVAAIAAGSAHTCALRRDHTVWCWAGRVAEPTQVAGLPAIRDLAAGGNRTCAIGRDGSLWCWGDNRHGQLGDGTAIDRPAPVRIGLDGVVAVSLAFEHGCALRAAGEVWCWGQNDDGILGNGGLDDSASPVRAWPIATAPPPPSLAAPVPRTHESLACGVRVRASGDRVVEALGDLTVDEIVLQGGPGSVQVHCVLRDNMADKDADQLVARLGAGTTRLTHDGADCVDLAGRRGHRRICYTARHYVDVVVLDTTPAVAAEILDSLDVFDPGEVIRFPVVPSTAAAPAGMVAIPAGELAMGCTNTSVMSRTRAPSCSEDEMPLHRVELSAFAIDKAEVTWQQYQACVVAGACGAAAIDDYRRPEREPDRPITNVTWDQASGYCAWRGARLPTEAEWEMAARGTDGRPYVWGSEETGVDVSPYGVHDLAMSVREWVADRYLGTYYAVSPRRDPQGPSRGAMRVTRGSSDQWAVEVHRRRDRAASTADDDLGFRCAAALTP